MAGFIDKFYNLKKNTQLIVLCLISGIAFIIMFIKAITIFATITLVLLILYWVRCEFDIKSKRKLLYGKTDNEILILLKEEYSKLESEEDKFKSKNKSYIKSQSYHLKKLDKELNKNIKMLQELSKKQDDLLEKRNCLFEEGHRKKIRQRNDGCFYSNSELGQSLNALINNIDNEFNTVSDEISKVNKEIRGLNSEIDSCRKSIENGLYHPGDYIFGPFESIFDANPPLTEFGKINKNIGLYKDMLSTSEQLVELKCFMVYARVVLILFIIIYFVILNNPLSRFN